MKGTILKIVAFSIILGVMALSLNLALGQNTIVFIEKQQVYYTSSTHFYIWKFNFWEYISNLQTSTSDVSVLQFKLPTRTWMTDTEAGNVWDSFINNMALLLDYVILILNVLLYPIKLGAYFLQNILALIGVNQNPNAPENGLAWLIRFEHDILGNFSIPYV